ncbi:hypothetical protein PAENIP36_69070 [Paenibacillus sp. P36]
MWRHFVLLISPIVITFNGVYLLITKDFLYTELIILLVGIVLLSITISEINNSMLVVKNLSRK